MFKQIILNQTIITFAQSNIPMKKKLLLTGLIIFNIISGYAQDKPVATSLANGGKTWALTTQRDLEINSIAVHPSEPNRVYIGTNNYGVMVSNDGGKNFAPTNQSVK